MSATPEHPTAPDGTALIRCTSLLGRAQGERPSNPTLALRSFAMRCGARLFLRYSRSLIFLRDSRDKRLSNSMWIDRWQTSSARSMASSSKTTCAKRVPNIGSSFINLSSGPGTSAFARAGACSGTANASSQLAAIQTPSEFLPNY